MKLRFNPQKCNNKKNEWARNGVKQKIDDIFMNK